jgi:hypothetical protein
LRIDLDPRTLDQCDMRLNAELFWSLRPVCAGEMAAANQKLLVNKLLTFIGEHFPSHTRKRTKLAWIVI